MYCNCARKALCGHLSILVLQSVVSESSEHPQLRSAQCPYCFRGFLRGNWDTSCQLWLGEMMRMPWCACCWPFLPFAVASGTTIQLFARDVVTWVLNGKHWPVDRRVDPFTAVWTSWPSCGPVHRRVDQFTAVWTSSPPCPLRRRARSTRCLLLAVFDLIAVAVTLI